MFVSKCDLQRDIEPCVLLQTSLIDASNKDAAFVSLYQSIVQNAEDSAKVPTIIGAPPVAS